MLRKVLCLVLSVFCVVAFVGCGGKSASSTKEKKLEVMASFYPSQNLPVRWAEAM